MTAHGIDRGDVVRLPGGETMTVRSVYDSYHDADGEHVGPFVSGADYRLHWPVADVELVAVNANRCEICGGGVTSPDPAAYPYCETCHYTGAVATLLRGKQIARFEQALPGAHVSVEHTGGGCFWMAVRFEEHADYYVFTDGEAELPEQENGGWRYVGLHSDVEDSPHYEGTPIRTRDFDEPGFSDDYAAGVVLRHRAEAAS